MAERDRLDLVIRGATVYDGSGAPPFSADVGVRGDRIAAIAGDGTELPRGGVELDARGLALAPGFIDVHTHDDFAVIAQPEMDFKVMQGVTTDVVGNCGMGAAPYEIAQVAARAFHPDRTLPRWEGYGGYLRALDDDPASLNVAVLVGHGTIRAASMADARRAPDAAELDKMRALLCEGLEAGAVGFSTGLIYEPGRNANTDELIALAREMSGIGGLYATHMRNESKALLASISETLEIGEAGGVPVQISHHKASGREAWGLVKDSLRLIDEARTRGVDVTADQYPYTAGSTMLSAVVQNARPPGEAPGGIGQLEGESIVVAGAMDRPEYDGKSLAELGNEWGVDPMAAAARVLEESPNTWVVMHSMDEEDVKTVMAHPSTMIGSDGIPSEGGKPHPRLYGTFARVLGHYARDEGVLSLEEAVHRMTGFPATKFRLEGRGFVREGALADLVVFDPATVDDVSSYADPRRHPAGIRDVFVNGTAVARDGRHTGARPGRALRRP